MANPPALPTAWDGRRPRINTTAWALAAIVVAAAAVRFWHVTQLPPGYWYDEAHKSVVALAISRGQRFPIYVTDFQGIEAGYFWLLAGWFRLFGPSFFGTRYLAASLGTATVPLTYWAITTVYQAHPMKRLIGLGAAAWLAFLLWHMLWSRLGFELIMVPLFSVALLGLMAWAWQREQAWAFAAAGAVLGLSLYTNPAARALPLQALVTFGLLAHGPWRHRIRLGLVFLAAATLVFAPLGAFFIRNPQWFLARAAFASSNTRAGGLAAYLDNALKTALSLNFQGDALPRHNLSLRPAFDPISSAWMLAGLISFWPRREAAEAPAIWRAHGAVLAALVINYLPSILSDGAPEFGRALGAVPFLVVLPALGLAVAARILTTPAGRAILLLTVVAAAGWNLLDLFYRFPRQPGLFDAFEIGEWSLVKGAFDASQSGTGYLLVDEPSLIHPTTQMAEQLMPGDLRVLNGLSCLAYPAATTTPAVIAAMDAQRLALAQRLPGVKQQLILHEPKVYPYGALFSLPAHYTAPAASEAAVARLDGRLDLLLVSLPLTPTVAGAELPITLRWRVSQPLASRYNFFVHLANAEQPRVAGTDGEPCGGWYPTNVWHANEVVEHSVQLKLPGDLSPGRYSVMVGLYDWQTGARLSVVQQNQLEPDRALAGYIEVK